MAFFTNADKLICPWGPEFADEHGFCNPAPDEAHQHDPSSTPRPTSWPKIPIEPVPTRFAESEATFSPWRSTAESWRLFKKIQQAKGAEQYRLQEQYDARIAREAHNYRKMRATGKFT
jgi:hypothetical protein